MDPGALNARQTAGDFDFLISGPTRVAADQFLYRFLSTNRPNFYGKIDNLILAQSREVNRAKRLQLLRDIQMRLGVDLPAIPLHRQIYVTAYRKGVTGAVPNTFFWLFYWEMMDITK